MRQCRGGKFSRVTSKEHFYKEQKGEEKREIYAWPVEELADALAVPRDQPVQLLKACYGLVNVEVVLRDFFSVGRVERIEDDHFHQNGTKASVQPWLKQDLKPWCQSDVCGGLENGAMRLNSTLQWDWQHHT